MVKGPHRFVFRYYPGCESELLGALVALANDPDSEFDWFDAAVLSYQLGQHLSRDLDSAVALEEV